MGSGQGDAIRNIAGTIDGLIPKNTSTGPTGSGAFKITHLGNLGAGGTQASGAYLATFNAGDVVPVSTENRPVSTAYHPRIHI